MRWSKPTTNRFGVPVRASKCGRACIAKINPPGALNLFLPSLDGEPLPVYWKLREAKDAVEAADTGRPLPRPTRPTTSSFEYEHMDPTEAAENWQRTKAWFQAQRDRGAQEDPFDVLGLPQDADEFTIRRRVRELQHENHPDRNPGDAGAAERFQRVTQAWRRLEATM